MRFLASLVIATLLSGCGWVMVNNPRRSGLDCTDSRFWPITDFVIAGAGAAALAQSGGGEGQAFAGPAFFVATGLWGLVKVGRCKKLWREATPEQIAMFNQQMAARRAAEEAARQAAAAEYQRQQQIALEQQMQQQRAWEEQQAREPQPAAPPVESPPPQQTWPQPAPPPAPRPVSGPPPNVTITQQTTVVPRGVWRTRAESECNGHDFAAKAKLDQQNAWLRNQTMREACTKCVRQGKLFFLDSETAPIYGCE